MDRKLPDTPWHVGYTKKHENDPRRHRSRCKYYHNQTKKCTCVSSPYCGLRCGGSAHCGYYIDCNLSTKEQKETIRREIKEGNRLAPSIHDENARKAIAYRLNKIEIRKKTEERMGKEMLRERYGKAVDCPICENRFEVLSDGRRICKYCGLEI